MSTHSLWVDSQQPFPAQVLRTESNHTAVWLVVNHWGEQHLCLEQLHLGQDTRAQPRQAKAGQKQTYISGLHRYFFFFSPLDIPPHYFIMKKINQHKPTCKDAVQNSTHFGKPRQTLFLYLLVSCNEGMALPAMPLHHWSGGQKYPPFHPYNLPHSLAAAWHCKAINTSLRSFAPLVSQSNFTLQFYIWHPCLLEVAMCLNLQQSKASVA